jgi:hypothetical protein
MRISAGLRRTAIAALAAIWLATGVGCSSLTAPSVPSISSIPSMGSMFEKEEPIVDPSGVAVVWTGALLEKEASLATRGFGGMLTFYGEDKKKPVRVDGQLTVYAYGNLSPDHDNSTPDRKYVFTAEQLKTHYSEGALGPSYSVWIPWDGAGGPRQEIGLIARFDSVEGKTVMGKPTHNVLAGAKITKDRKTSGTNNEQTAHLSPVDGVNRSSVAKASGPQMKTVTLTVPSRGTRPMITVSENTQQPLARN